MGFGVPDLASNREHLEGFGRDDAAIIDTEPLVAFFDRAEQHHRCRRGHERRRAESCNEDERCRQRDKAKDLDAEAGPSSVMSGVRGSSRANSRAALRSLRRHLQICRMHKLLRRLRL
jgi:hypothetical protein